MASDDDDTTLLIVTDPEIPANHPLHRHTPTQSFHSISSNTPPPPYTDDPPPYEQNPHPPPPNSNVTSVRVGVDEFVGMGHPPYPPNLMMVPPQASVGVMGDPTVVCRVCHQLVFVRGRESQRVVKCSNCHEATPIKAPPTGKKYIRCPCNALLTCRSTSARISCPRANCKRVINVGGGDGIGGPTLQNTATQHRNNGAESTNNTGVMSEEQRIRVTCGHCNETFVFRTNAHLARCPYCRNVSSVGAQFAKHRAVIFAVIGAVFLIIGVGVTIGTYKLARESGGIYVTWFGAFVVGILNLMRCCYYCTMTISEIEPDDGQA